MKIKGFLIDLEINETYPAEIYVSGKIIKKISRINDCPDVYIMPGLIDAHIHIESSMVSPSAFGCTAVKHGTTGVIADPHEIANVLGIEGINFMLNDAKSSPLHFWFGVPSCVPATNMESSGAVLNSEDVGMLLDRDDMKFLSEMMNFPGVVNGEEEVVKKLQKAIKIGKPIDGHAPGLTGVALKKYIENGISTDHECCELNEALEKISYGMKILIREGSAAKNLDKLKPLYYLHPEKLMLCSDDIHPEMLVKRHINKLVSSLISEGFNRYDVIKSATINPCLHYGMGQGLIKEGSPADFIIVDDPSKMNVLETWIDGVKVYCRGNTLIKSDKRTPINNFNSREINTDEIRSENRIGKLRILSAFDGMLFTGSDSIEIKELHDYSRLAENDILKIVLKERYRDLPPSTGYIKGFGLKRGAIAGSVSHDSHNILAVGTNDEDIVNAVNEIVRMKGGLAVSESGRISSLQLQIGGIMSVNSVEEVAAEYTKLDTIAKELGSTLSAPFMTLSFMALLVIPELKIGDRGLFDVRQFKTVSLFID